MKCWHCKTKLIWRGDYDMEEEDEYDIVTNLSCPECNTYIEVYHSFEIKRPAKTKEEEKCLE